ncbi:MAG TPA: EamA family transporter [bacterium]|nr:EamA family transporter [bacterium]
MDSFLLPSGGLLSGAGPTVHLRKGRVWLTAEGDPGDYLLEAGQWYRGKGRARLLVEALEDSELQMSSAPPEQIEAKFSRLGLWLCFAIVYLVWGSTYLAIRFAVESLPPFGMAGARFLTAGLLVASALFLKREALPRPGEILGAFLIGVLLLVVGNGGVVWAERSGLPSGIAAMIVATTPLWMMVLDRFFGRRQRLQPLKLLAGIAGLGGVVLLVYPSNTELLPAVPLLPALLVVASAFSWSLGSVLSRSIRLPKSPWWTTALEMIGGGLVLLLLAFVRGEASGFELSAVTAASLASWVYLVVFGSVVAFSAYLYMLKHSNPARVSTYALVNPAVALLLGWSLGGEELSARIGLAALIILPSVFVLVWEGKARKERGHPERSEYPNYGHKGSATDQETTGLSSSFVFPDSR